MAALLLDAIVAGLALAAGLELGAMACAPVASQTRGASGCRTVDDVTVPAHLDYLKRMVVSSDSTAVAFRSAYGLQATTASKVAVVTRSSTCASAAGALNVVAGTPGVVRQVWVYSLGNNYAVEDPSIPVEPMGDYPIFFFDRDWQSKPVLMY